MDSSEKVDFQNPFDAVTRVAILHLPELLPQLLFPISTLRGPSDLQFGDLTLQSEEGAEQGDPLSP